MSELKHKIFNELENIAVLERRVAKASTFTVKDTALALAKSQRRVIAMLASAIFDGGTNGQ
ncbi:hypothetical protein [Pseudoalteromonas xiamenensis]